tara:strand:+ start:9102 stop:9710 length:609 start_codon:yes stop_codon:yes gene_type:complete
MGSDGMEILFATSNSHKVYEASATLSQFGYIVSQLEINGKIPELTEPQSEGIDEVALSKIRQARELVRGTQMEDKAILVEDSGIFIESLDGFPGPYSSYVERTIGLRGILDLLQTDLERRAEYRAVAVISMEGETISASGVCCGTISKKISGDMGFGFDPIFIPEDGDGRTCGEMTPDEKSAMSHRGRALKALSELLNLPSK